jgi:hypothetical protein
MVTRGDLPETQLDQLPAEQFPLVRSVATAAFNHESVWDFSVETLILGLRTRLAQRGPSE